MTLPRDQANVSAAGVLSVEEVATFDTTEIVDGVLTVTTRVAPDVDRTFVTADGVLTVVEGVGGWAPSDLGADLLAEWTAARADLITLGTGADVASLDDTVAAYELAEATNRPDYSATSFGGEPGITFNGTADILGIESMPIPSGADPLEFWFLVDQTALPADTTARHVAGWGAGNTTNGQGRIQRVVVGGVNRARAIIGTGAGVVTITDTAVDFSGIHYGRVVIDGANIRLDIDGNTGTPSACVPSIGTTRLRLGANASNSPGGFWQGQIAKAIATNLLDAGQAAQMEEYLGFFL